MNVLVINCGSSSIKFQVLDPDTAKVAASGLVERIGEPDGRIAITVGDHTAKTQTNVTDHRTGLRHVLSALENADLLSGLSAVGHRVVHGGEIFYAPTVIDTEVAETISELATLAPLHNPANRIGIDCARELLADLPQVAVFDTAFFHQLPPVSYTYAIDFEVAREYGIRRYGFHGTSHEYVARAAADFLGRPMAELNLIVFHLGNGASASAIRGGQAVDTTMGFTPLEGLVMGTRSGDIDPGVLFHLERAAEMSVSELDSLLNRQSGVKGLCGVNDFRELTELMLAGDDAAKLAYDVYVHRLRKYLGAYLIELGRVDAIVFTAGVGENAAAIRADTLANLENFGIVVSAERNMARESAARYISPDSASVAALVVPTNEELAIAQATAKVLADNAVAAGGA